MAIERNITEDDDLFIGEDKSLVFTIYQSGTTAEQIAAGTAVAQNITGWTLSWLLKKKITDADVDAALTKTTVSGIALTTPLSGVCTVSISDTDTDALLPATYVHELKRTDAGSETILTFGKCTIRRAVHRS